MTVNVWKKRLATRRDRFLVGYVSRGNVLFGKGERNGSPVFGGGSCTEPMTRRQAERLLEKMPCAGAGLFELKLVAVNR